MLGWRRYPTVLAYICDAHYICCPLASGLRNRDTGSLRIIYNMGDPFIPGSIYIYRDRLMLKENSSGQQRKDDFGLFIIQDITYIL